MNSRRFAKPPDQESSIHQPREGLNNLLNSAVPVFRTDAVPNESPTIPDLRIFLEKNQQPGRGEQFRHTIATRITPKNHYPWMNVRPRTGVAGLVGHFPWVPRNLRLFRLNPAGSSGRRKLLLLLALEQALSARSLR
jgi:hypothetical protein